ncbi:hypothetical protein IW261DRAFT_987148 [Armillaria novae-zelandiae]|uniref:Uncharacterized protein n=1 Tax=Armillaria novae-zelandiae TaxID=153914 RepID=A0AA39PGM2_9AGAR|nr:hypothetical protein IW261DRAFT_987148 [Armillaria novae-zelandiae]
MIAPKSRVEPDDNKNVHKLIHSIEHSSMCHSNILVENIAKTLSRPSDASGSPRCTKEPHYVLDIPGPSDDDFGKGLREFYEMCKKMEPMTLKDAEEVKEVHQLRRIFPTPYAVNIRILPYTSIWHLGHACTSSWVFLGPWVPNLPLISFRGQRHVKRSLRHSISLQNLYVYVYSTKTPSARLIHNVYCEPIQAHGPVTSTYVGNFLSVRRSSLNHIYDVSTFNPPREHVMHASNSNCSRRHLLHGPRVLYTIAYTIPYPTG